MQPLRRCQDERDPISVKHYLPFFGKIDSDAPANVGLHLPDTPFRTIRMAHQHAWCQNCVHPRHLFLPRGTPMTRRPDLTALVTARICHDLVSPLGAIGNGVELMTLSGLAQTPEMALIEESVQNANARVRFFRVAYGGATPDQSLSRAEITSTLLAAGRGGRISYHWDVAGDQPRTEVRIAFLLLQCFESAMPMGGDIKISHDDGMWALVAEANRLKVDSSLWDSLTNPRARVSVTAAQVQFALLPEVLMAAGRHLEVSMTDTRLSARF